MDKPLIKKNNPTFPKLRDVLAVNKKGSVYQKTKANECKDYFFMMTNKDSFFHIKRKAIHSKQMRHMDYLHIDKKEIQYAKHGPALCPHT